LLIGDILLGGVPYQRSTDDDLLVFGIAGLVGRVCGRALEVIEQDETFRRGRGDSAGTNRVCRAGVIGPRGVLRQGERAFQIRPAHSSRDSYASNGRAQGEYGAG
jgi:hypothetical protein